MLPVGTQLSVAESYNSAVAVPPPATSTWPLGSSVAVWPYRGVLMLAVGAQVPVVGSYNSALVRAVPVTVQGEAKEHPPLTSTWPLGSSVAV
jgi:hypothetical protein